MYMQMKEGCGSRILLIVVGHVMGMKEGMPLWGPNRFWPGSGLVLRCLGPGFTVLALGPGFRPIFIHSCDGGT